MAKFDLSSVFGTVPGLGTSEERITYICEQELQEDCNNFYSIDGIEELAANIELVGLQQPLRVRPDPDDEGAYLIVSGHRRLTAIRTILKKDDPEKWKKIPCIIEDRDEPDAMRELRLIYANSDTRRMTSADISAQAERVESLLYQLKELGYEFPGRMRDHVAQACNVSKSKLSRLKVIRENLCPGYVDKWKAGKMPEDLAYSVAQLPADMQDRIFVAMRGNVPDTRNVKRIKDDGRTYQSSVCPKGGACINTDRILAHDLKCYVNEQCGGNRCCLECTEGGKKTLVSCGAACDKMCKHAKAVYCEKKAKAKDENKRKADEAESKRKSEAQRYAERIAKAADASGLLDDARVGGDRCSSRTAADYRAVAQGDFDGRGSMFAAYSDFGKPYYASDVVGMAKALHCSADYVLELTDDISPVPACVQQTILSGWMPGGFVPGHPCDCVAKFRLSGENQIRRIVRWDGDCFRFDGNGAVIELDPITWMELPEEPDGT